MPYLGFAFCPLQTAALSSILLMCIILARVAFVLPTCLFANLLWRKKARISLMDSIIIAWGGLSRGSLTLALTYHHFGGKHDNLPPDPENQTIIVAIVGIVLVTTVTLGAVTGPLMDFLMTRHKVCAAVLTAATCLNCNSAVLSSPVVCSYVSKWHIT